MLRDIFTNIIEKTEITSGGECRGFGVTKYYLEASNIVIICKYAHEWGLYT